jgi:hypothetical protein
MNVPRGRLELKIARRRTTDQFACRWPTPKRPLRADFRRTGCKCVAKTNNSKPSRIHF